MTATEVPQLCSLQKIDIPGDRSLTPPSLGILKLFIMSKST